MPKKNKIEMPELEEHEDKGTEIPELEPITEIKKPFKPAAPAPRKGLGEELIGVYQSSGDEFRSLNSFDHRTRTWQRMLVWILFFLVAVFVGVAGVSWYIWGRQPRFNGENVAFEITVPEEVTSGSLITYSVRYANNESVGFRKSEVELRYPSGFIFVSADPKPLSGNTLWDLGSLGAGREGTIEVEGYLVGRSEVESTISGTFRYWPANFSSEFSEVALGQTVVNSVNLDARLEGPDEILAGQKTSFTVIYNNPAEEALKDLRLEVIYPEGFVVDAVKPELAEQNKFLLIPELPTNEEREVQIDGYFSSAPEEPVMFAVEFAQRATEDEYFFQKRLTHETSVVKGDLVVNVIANGVNKDSSMQWGQTLNGSIAFQNNSETTLSDITVVAVLESRYRTKKATKGQGALDWTTLIDAARGSLKELPGTDDKSLRVRSIAWTGEDVEELEKLEAGDEGTINFQIDLFDLAAAAKQISSPEDVELVLTAEVTVGKTGGVNEELKVTGNPIRFAINSDLVLAGESRYFDAEGNQVGSGPLPPVVDQKTKYRAYWTMANSLHEVQDVLVSTDLPENVAWVNSFEVSAGEVLYNASKHTLTWRLNKMPLDVKDVLLSFDLELTPTAQQAGKTAPLTQKMTLTAVDSITGGKIIQTLNPLTTGVENDDQASDKGIVVR